MGKFLAVVVFVCSFNLFASEVWVRGAVASDSNCVYFNTNTGYFWLAYSNNDWRVGDKVFVKYAFTNEWDQRGRTDWFGETVKEMRQDGRGVWLADIEEVVSARGYFFLSKLNFVIMAVNSLGVETVDKGNTSLLGYYQVNVPEMECSRKEMKDLTIRSIEKN